MIGCVAPPGSTNTAVKAWARSLENLPTFDAVQQAVAANHPGQQSFDKQMSQKLRERHIWNLVDQFMIEHQADVSSAARVTQSRHAPHFYGRFLDPIITPLGEVLFGPEGFEGHVLQTRYYAVVQEMLRIAWERQATQLSKAAQNLQSAMDGMEKCLAGKLSVHESFAASQCFCRISCCRRCCPGWFGYPDDYIAPWSAARIGFDRTSGG